MTRVELVTLAASIALALGGCGAAGVDSAEGTQGNDSDLPATSQGFDWNLVTSLVLPPNTPAVHLRLADTGGVSGQLGELLGYASVLWPQIMH